jgi:hypothetical protein
MKHTYVSLSTDPTVSFEEADIIFAYSTFYTANGQFLTELSEKLSSSTKKGARIITIDNKLEGPFKLLKTLDDPRGDLQLNRGFIWERV